MTTSRSKGILKATDQMVDQLRKLRFGLPITHVYNPLEYAREGWDAYVNQYGGTPREIVFLGMNPGPFGMAQTGVPFGEIQAVRDWMGIHMSVIKPKGEHPKRPIEGLACKRSEVSGARLWGWARTRYQTPQKFFERNFVLNYCPLVFMEETGRNFTPDKLQAAERERLFSVCDHALQEMVFQLEPKWVIGVGGFAAERARNALLGLHVKIGQILHPSPASPYANRGWSTAIEKQLLEMGISLV